MPAASQHRVEATLMLDTSANATLTVVAVTAKVSSLYEEALTQLNCFNGPGWTSNGFDLNHTHGRRCTNERIDLINGVPCWLCSAGVRTWGRLGGQGGGTYSLACAVCFEHVPTACGM